MSARIADLHEHFPLEEIHSLSLVKDSNFSGSSGSYDVKESKELEEVVVIKRKKTVYGSPFYNLIWQLRKEKHSSVQSLVIAEIQNDLRDAFLITIDFPPINHLFPEYQYQERHFAIDKIYKKSETTQHGKAPIHYTETYFSKGLGEHIVVHGYLNKHGHYIYSQAKKYNGSIELGIIKIGKYLENSIRNNIDTSTAVLDFLLEERKNRYSKAKETVDRLELELGQQFENLRKSSNISANLSKYIETAKEFISAVEELNQYGELTHPGGLFVSRVVDNFEIWSKQLLDISKPKSVSLELPTLTETGETLCVAAEPTENLIEAFYHTTFAELEKQVEFANTIPQTGAIYTISNLEKIQQLQDCIENLNQQLILAFGLPEEFLKKHYKNKKDKLFNNIYQKTVDYHKRCLILFETEAFKGNLEATQQLFPLVGKKIKNDFYVKLINAVISSKSESERKKLAEICNFLHEHSEDYTNVVLSLSRESYYFLSNQDFRSLFPVFTAHEDLNVSVLFKLYCDNNLTVFRMLLRHGADPNTYGFMFNNINQKTYNVLYSIASYPTDNYLDYLELLLTYHADANLIYTKVLIDITNKEKMQNSRFASKFKKSLKTAARTRAPVSNFHHVVTIDSVTQMPLTLVACRSGLAGLQLFLPYTFVENIAYSLGYMVFDKKICNRSFISTEPFISFEKDRKSAYNKVAQYEVCEDASPFLSFVVYPHGQEGFEEGNENRFKKLEIMRKTLATKLKAFDKKEQFEIAYNWLFNKGKEELLKNEPKDAYRAFSGCEYLLIEQCKLSSPKEQTILLKKYGPELSQQCKQALSGLPYDQVYKQAMSNLYDNRATGCKKIPRQKIQAELENLSLQPELPDNPLFVPNALPASTLLTPPSLIPLFHPAEVRDFETNEGLILSDKAHPPLVVPDPMSINFENLLISVELNSLELSSGLDSPVLLFSIARSQVSTQSKSAEEGLKYYVHKAPKFPLK